MKRVIVILLCLLPGACVCPKDANGKRTGESCKWTIPPTTLGLVVGPVTVGIKMGEQPEKITAPIVLPDEILGVGINTK